MRQSRREKRGRRPDSATLKTYGDRIGGMSTMASLASIVFSISTIAIRPKPVTMQELTVPPNRLTEGCRLKAADQTALRKNPWIGSDRQMLATLRQQMDGQRLRVPDAPPTLADAAALRAQLSKGVEEGYSAVYAQSAAPDLVVEAVRFTTPQEPSDFYERRPNVTRINIGTIQMVLFGDQRPCSKAIEGYLNGLGKSLTAGSR